MYDYKFGGDTSFRKDPVVVRLNRTLSLADRIDNALARFAGFTPEYGKASRLGVYSGTQGRTQLGTSFRFVSPPMFENGVHPSLNQNPRTKIGGIHLMESVAFYWELYASGKFSTYKRFTQDALSAILAIIGDYSDWDRYEYDYYAAPIIYIINELGLAGFYIFPIIVDVALCAPMPNILDTAYIPSVMRLESSDKLELLIEEWNCKITLTLDKNDIFHYSNEGFEWKWEDVHPGWRFVRIVDLLKKTWLTDNFSHLSGWENEDYLNLSTHICEELSWPPPTEALASTIGMVFSAEGEDQINAVHRWRQLDKANLQRLAEPYLFHSPVEQLFNLREFPPPLTVCSSGEKRFLFTSVQAAEDTLADYFNSQLSDIFLPPIVPELMPKSYRVFACPFASEHFQDICAENLEVKSQCTLGNFPNYPCPLQEQLQKHFDISKENIHVL